MNTNKNNKKTESSKEMDNQAEFQKCNDSRNELTQLIKSKMVEMTRKFAYEDLEKKFACEGINISYHTARRYALGEIIPDVVTLKSLLDICGKDFNFLLNNTEEQSESDATKLRREIQRILLTLNTRELQFILDYLTLFKNFV